MNTHNTRDEIAAIFDDCEERRGLNTANARIQYDALRTRLYILENLREQVARQAKSDKDGRGKVNTFEAARLALVAEALEPETPRVLQCQHGRLMSEVCQECRKLAIEINQPTKNNRVA